MNKWIFLVLLLAGLGYAAPDISISLLNTSATVQSGTDFSIQVQVSNSGDREAKDVVIAPEVKSPFSIRAGASAEETIDQLNAGDTASATFHLTVAPGTPSSLYDLKIKATYVSGLATLTALVFGVPLGTLLAFKRFPGRGFVVLAVTFEGCLSCF